MGKNIYKSVITIEVLSDYPIRENMDIESIVNGIEIGYYEATVNWEKTNEKIQKED